MAAAYQEKLHKGKQALQQHLKVHSMYYLGLREQPENNAAWKLKIGKSRPNLPKNSNYCGLLAK